jgi:hypothetical protein
MILCCSNVPELWRDLILECIARAAHRLLEDCLVIEGNLSQLDEGDNAVCSSGTAQM